MSIAETYRAEGRREGRREGKLEVASKLFQKGFPLETVQEVTKLPSRDLLALSPSIDT